MPLRVAAGLALGRALELDVPVIVPVLLDVDTALAACVALLPTS